MGSNKFCRGIKDKFGKIDYCALEEYDLEYEKRGYKRLIDRRKKPGRVLGHNAIRFMLNILQRSRQLFSSFIENVNSENTIASFLVTRAHYETTGSMAYLFRNLQRYYNREIEFKDMDSILYRLSLGSKTLPKKDCKYRPVEPINVLTQIDTADRVVKGIFRGKGKSLTETPFRYNYDFLSEFCHPNFLGITADCELMNNPDGSKTVVYFEKPAFKRNDLGRIISCMKISCSLFFAMYDASFKAIESNESMPVLEK